MSGFVGAIKREASFQ